ncbi:MAG: hypothetical protein ACRC1F_00390 [Metamycoplasmataceae bacterium]
MYAFVIVTNKIKFSTAVKDYFVSMSPINFNAIKVFVFGTDVNTEEEIIDQLKKIPKNNPKITNCFVFSDFGDSFFSAKLIEEKISNATYSKNSLIESGFLAFQLINGGAPIESIMIAMNREVGK